VSTPAECGKDSIMATVPTTAGSIGMTDGSRATTRSELTSVSEQEEKNALVRSLFCMNSLTTAAIAMVLWIQQRFVWGSY